MCRSKITTHAVRNHWFSIAEPINVIAQKSDSFLSVFYFFRYIAANKGRFQAPSATELKLFFQ